jgi:hypothetical protein
MATDLALFVLRAVVRHLGSATLHNGSASLQCISHTLDRVAE